MPPAVIAAGVGAAASIGGAAIAGGAQKKAAKTAVASADRNNAANNALARENRDMMFARLDPYSQMGLPAGQMLNAMLGLGSPGGGSTGGAAPAAAPASFYAGPSRSIPGEPGAFFMRNPQMMDESPIMQQQYGAPQPVAQQAGPDPQNAFRNFIANSDYAFNLGEGTNALNHGYAARGGLESGAAMKAMERFRQNLQQGYRGEYMDRLFQQQGIGLSGASALAGVGQGFVNNVTQNNNNAASVAANAALARGNATAGLYGNIAGGIQNFANSLGSSYGGNNSFAGYGSAPGTVYGYRPTGGALGM